MSEYTKSSPEIISIPKISNEQIRNNLQYNLFPIINLNMLNPENLKYEIQYPNYNSLYINYLFQNFLLAQTNLKLQNKKKIKNEEVENVNNILLGKKKEDQEDYVQNALINFHHIMQKECVLIVITQKEEVKNLGIVLIQIKHIML